MERRRRRLPRLLLNTATVVSLALCAGVVALWIRSHWVADTVYGPSSLASTWSARSNRGVITVGGRHRPFAASQLAKILRHKPQANLSEVRPGGYSREEARDTPPPVTPSPSLPGVRYAGQLGRVSWIIADGGAYAGGYAAPVWQVSMPHWVLVAALGALPIRYVIARLLWGRKGTGLCPACGYDLRATPDRCPECGTIPPQ